MWNRNEKKNWPERSKVRTAFVMGWRYTPWKKTEWYRWSLAYLGESDGACFPVHHHLELGP